MEKINYIIVILILINLLIQLGIILKYFSLFVISFLLNKKQPWNSDYDRLFSAFFLVLFGLSLYLSRSFLNFQYNNYFTIIVFVILIGMTVSIYLIYRKRNSINKKPENLNPKKVDEIVIEYKDDINENILKELYDNELIYNNRCEVSFENLELFARGQKMNTKIKWIDKKGQKSTTDAKSKDITFGFIFDMLHENIIKDGIKNLKGKKRSLIMDLIVQNFTKDNQIIKKENINKAYNNWTPVRFADSGKSEQLEKSNS